MKLNNDFKIHIVQYKNLYSNSCNGSGLCEWSKWLEKLQTPRINSDKYIRGLCVYGDFEDVEKDNQNISKYRSDQTLINRTAITLDYDEIKDFRGLYEVLKAKLEHVSWVFHTTYSYTVEKPRIRLIVPLNEPVSASDYRKYSNGLARYIGYPVDEASFVPSQAMALPVKKSNDSIYIFKYNDAPILKVETLKNWSEETKKQIDQPITTNFNKRDDAYWRDISFSVAKGNRNNSLASLIGHLFSRHVNEYIVYSYALLWGQNACKPPLKEREINATFQSILKKHRNK